MINVGSMIGSGIFLVPAAVALYLPSWPLVLLVWLGGGVVSLFGALSVAELGAIYPSAGGQFVYLRETYGTLWGFLYGWTAFAVIMTASISAVAVAFATYLGYFLAFSPVAVKCVAIGSILILTAVNCIGVKVGAIVQNSFTILKMAMLAVFVILGAARGSAANLQTSNDFPSLTGLVGPFGLALVAVLWAYDGWIEISYVAGEVKEPQRNIPGSLIIGTLLVIVIYMATNFIYIFTLSLGKVAHSELVAADAMTVLLGSLGAGTAVIGVIIATLGCNNGFVLTGARIYYAMAKENTFFATLGRVHPRFRTPVSSLVAQGVWASLLVLTGSFAQLFTYVIFTSWIFYALTAGAVIVARKKYPDRARPYKTLGYPVTPLVFIAFSLYLVANTLIEDPRDAGIGLGIVALGLPLYAYWNRSGARVRGRLG